ncbi:MAG: Mo-dependent nitrogenase C-terminal domain-containing protein [Pleurocapsa sp.]
MSVKQYTAKNHQVAVWINNIQQKDFKSLFFNHQQKIDLLAPLRKWLNNLEINDPNLAHRLCKSIPNQCPFERQIEIFGHTILRIPPLCKLNPLYNEVVGLRFRAICYLADVCGEDVSSYC